MAFRMPGAASRRPLSPFHWCLLGKGGPYKLFIIKALFISLFKTRQNFSSITYSKGNHLREFLLKGMPDDCDESKGATRTPVSPRVPAVTEHPTPSSHRTTPHSPPITYTLLLPITEHPTTLHSQNTPLPSAIEHPTHSQSQNTPLPATHRTPHSLQSPNTPLPSCHRTPPITGDTILVCISAD